MRNRFTLSMLLVNRVALFGLGCSYLVVFGSALYRSRPVTIPLLMVLTCGLLGVAQEVLRSRSGAWSRASVSLRRVANLLFPIAIGVSLLNAPPPLTELWAVMMLVVGVVVLFLLPLVIENPRLGGTGDTGRGPE